MHVRTNGATFEDLSGTVSNTSLIVCSDGAVLDSLTISVPTGIRRDRAILIGASCAIGSISLISVDQQSNRLETFDAAIVVTGSGSVLGSVYIEKYDNGIRIDGVDSTTIGRLDGVSYVRLLWLHDASNVSIKGGDINTASVNATNTAGNNAILISCETVGATHDIHIENMRIADAGEHAIRIGGPEKIKQVWINDSTLTNCGSCGVKVLGTDAGAPSEMNENIFIESLVIEDCGEEGALTQNMCGVLVMYANNVVVKNVSVRKLDKTYSSFVGIRVASCSDVKIDTPDLSDAQFHGIWSDCQLSDNTRIYVNGGVVRTCGGDGFRATAALNTFRQVNVDGLVCNSNGGYGALMAAGGGSISDCQIRVKTYNNTTDAVSCDSAAVTLDITGNITALPSDAANGSIIRDPASGRIYARGGGSWQTINTLAGSTTWDPSNLADGAGETTTVTVTGAALGDFAVASFSLDLQGITLTAWVSSANTVSVRAQNETTGAINLASGTLRAIVTPH